jgi:hypothetical protein
MLSHSHASVVFRRLIASSTAGGEQPGTCADVSVAGEVDGGTDASLHRLRRTFTIMKPTNKRQHATLIGMSLMELSVRHGLFCSSFSYHTWWQKSVTATWKASKVQKAPINASVDFSMLTNELYSSRSDGICTTVSGM